MSSKAFVLIILMIFIVQGCKKEEEKIIKSQVNGQVQKGPFVNGTSITMSELNTSLAQTGNVFTTQITNNKGSFQIVNISLSSSFVEFSASGYYYDEIKGEISSSPLNLFALSDIRDISAVNVNILTHLEKQRVQYLMKQNKTFSEAKKAAQGEILGIFGISLNGISYSETLDITVNSEANAILLGISLVLQGNRSVGDMTELLANISNDLKSDGIINDASIISGLRNSAKSLNLVSIKSNLEKRFQELGITSNIPGFEKYVNDFLAYTGEKPSATTQLPSDVTINAATMNATINPNSLNTTVVFEWGKTTAYSDSIVATSTLSGSSMQNVTKNITGILPGTLYHFRVKARNSKGTTNGGDLTFTTLGQKAVLTDKPVSNLKASTVTLNAVVNPKYLNTNVVFKWGKASSAYTDSLPALQNPVTGNSDVNVNVNITGLEKSSVYYYKVYATNQLGVTTGEEGTFTTLNGLPVLTTNVAAPLSSSSGSSGGNITNDGGFDITSRGVCLSTNINPTINDLKFESGNGTGTFITQMTGLSPNTLYYIRAFAINSTGTAYGNQVSLTTDPLTVSDVDGNTYNVVRIGTQLWMKENLKTTKYSDGNDIPNVTDNSTWANLTTPAYSWYNNEPTTFKDVYGALYNWFAISPLKNGNKNVCPVSWHVPLDSEWRTLNTYLGGNSVAGGKLKETGSEHWLSPNVGATNESGFSARGSGSRDDLEYNGAFMSLKFQWVGWSSDEATTTHAWHYGMDNSSSGAVINFQQKTHGYSIRCLRDE